MPHIKYLDVDAEANNGSSNLLDLANLKDLIHLRSSCLPPEAALRLLKRTPQLRTFSWIVHGSWTEDTVSTLDLNQLPTLTTLEINTENFNAPAQLSRMLRYFPELETLKLEYGDATDELMSLM